MAGSEKLRKRPNTLPQTNAQLNLFACNREADHTLPGGCAVATHSLGDWTESVEGDPSLPGWEESTP
jgi:hypothetical protein